MMLVYAGEVRLMALDYANDPGVVNGATLTDDEYDIVIEMLEKRGEAAVEDAVLESPAPAIVDSQVRFWIDFADVAPGRYIVRGTVTLSNNEVAVAEAALVVE